MITYITINTYSHNYFNVDLKNKKEYTNLSKLLFTTI